MATTGSMYDTFYALAFGLLYTSTFTLIPLLYFFHERKKEQQRGELSYIVLVLKTSLIALFCYTIVDTSYRLLEANNVPVSYYMDIFKQQAGLNSGTTTASSGSSGYSSLPFDTD